MPLSDHNKRASLNVIFKTIDDRRKVQSMISPFTRRAAMILGTAAMMSSVPASAADLAITACRPDAGGMRSIVSAKKALTAGRPILVPRTSTEYDRTATVQRDRQDSEKRPADVWYRRQFVLLVGVAY
jgi:hypothetical protein